MSTKSYRCAFENAAYQIFSTPKPILNYILNNVSSEVLQKLYKTCKFFYAKIQIAVIDDDYFVGISDIPKCDDIHIQEWESLKNKFWIKCWFSLRGQINIKNVFAKIAKFEPFVLYVRFEGKFTYNEFKFLTEAGCIKNLELQIHVYYPDDSKVPVEDIITLLPKIESILVLYCTTTSKTLKKMMKMEHPKKYLGLRLFNVSQMFDPDEVVEFIKKKMEWDQIIILHYDTDEMCFEFGPMIYEKVLPHLSEESLTYFLQYYGIEYPPLIHQ